VAEEVQITNVGGEGVASEVTLARLTAVMEAMAKKKGIDPDEVNKKLIALRTNAANSASTINTASTRQY
jgi:hypothetical protein